MEEGLKEPDLFNPNEFLGSLQAKFSRPLIFGPIELTDLHLKEEDNPFPYEQVREFIAGVLERSPFLPENLCIHGFNVTVKGRNLKRRSTIVKHSRFLKNLEVSPVFPPEPEPVAEEEQEEGQEEPEDDS